MKRSFIVGIVGMYVLAVMGASSVSYAQTETQTQTKGKTGMGALVGGLLGATAGGVIGHDKGKTGEGVLIGGALGALGGAAVGSQMKTTTVVAEPTEATGTTVTPSSSQTISGVDAPKVTMKQVIYWTDQGVETEEIISRIRKSGQTFVLAEEDVAYLQKKGVSQLVIETMQGQ